MQRDKLAAEALRSSEARLRQIVETADEGIWLADAAGRTTFANPKMAAMVGSTPDEMMSRRLADFLGRVGGEADHYDIRYSRPDGSEGCAFVSGSPVRGADGAVTGALAMVTDVTDRVAAERDSKAMEALLHQSQRLESLGQLAGGVAHDMNNLLAVILNFSDLALSAVDGGPGTEELHEIRHASESGVALVRQLLLFAKQEVTQPEVLDLNPLLEALDGLLRGALAEQIDFKTTYGTGLPPIRADAGMIEQVVMNLAMNARDAMPDGGRLDLTTSIRFLDPGKALDAAPGEYVCVCVGDTGVGMPSEVVARAFDPFFSTKPRGSGTGLGLSTVYGIAARFGGYVELDSELGRGTTVRVCFPAADPAQLQDGPRSEPELLVTDVVTPRGAACGGGGGPA